MASNEEVKLDELLVLVKDLVYYTRDEINIHPDTIRPGMQPIHLQQLSGNMSAPLSGYVEIFDRDGFRWIRIQLRDVMGTPVLSREWQCVYRDPYSGTLINRSAR